MLIIVIGSGSEVVRKIQLNNYKWKGPLGMAWSSLVSMAKGREVREETGKKRDPLCLGLCF